MFHSRDAMTIIIVHDNNIIGTIFKTIKYIISNRYYKPSNS